MAVLRDPAGVLLSDAAPATLPALVDVRRAGAARALARVFPRDRYPLPRDRYPFPRDPGGGLGFAAIRDDEPIRLGTARKDRGTGAAATAPGRLAERLAATCAARARWRVFTDNHGARRFHRRPGWRCTDRLSRTSFSPHPGARAGRVGSAGATAGNRTAGRSGR